MPKVIKIILPVIFWALFAYVVLKVDYPDKITSAGLVQISSFFISLFFALTFTLNFFLTFFFSFSIAFGIIILLTLKSLGSLNIVSFVLTATAILLMLSYFKKTGKNKWGIRGIRGIGKRNRV